MCRARLTSSRSAAPIPTTIVSSTPSLKPGQKLSHTSEPTFDLVLSVTDGPALLSKHLLVTADRAAVPTEVNLSNITVRDNVFSGIMARNLVLLEAAGLVQIEIIGDPNSRSALDDSKLVTLANFDFESTISSFVTLRGSDQAGRFMRQVSVIRLRRPPTCWAGAFKLNCTITMRWRPGWPILPSLIGT